MEVFAVCDVRVNTQETVHARGLGQVEQYMESAPGET